MRNEKKETPTIDWKVEKLKDWIRYSSHREYCSLNRGGLNCTCGKDKLLSL